MMTLVMVSGDGDDCLGWWIVHDLEHKASAKLNSLGNRGIKLPGCGAYILLHPSMKFVPTRKPQLKFTTFTHPVAKTYD